MARPIEEVQVLCPNPECPDVTMFGVQGEYGAGVLSCPKCGTELVEKLPLAPVEQEVGVWREPGGDEDDSGTLGELRVEEEELVEVVTCDYRHEAELVTSFLEARGIPARVAYDDCGSVHPVVGYARSAGIEVRRRDAEAALEMLEAFEVEGGQAAESPVPDDGVQESQAMPDGLDELRARARNARLTMLVGVVLFPQLVEPIAHMRAMRALGELKQHPAEAPELRRSLVVTAFGSAVLSIISWAWAIWWLRV